MYKSILMHLGVFCFLILSCSIQDINKDNLEVNNKTDEGNLEYYYDAAPEEFCQNGADNPPYCTNISEPGTFKISGKIRDRGCGYPDKFIEGVQIHIRDLQTNKIVETAITDQNGYFEFQQQFDRSKSYEETWTVPGDYYSEPEYKKQIRANSVIDEFDGSYEFLLKGITLTFSDKNGSKIVGGAFSVTAGNIFHSQITDEKGCAHVPATLVPGVLNFEKEGYDSPAWLNAKHMDSTHTIIGGGIVDPI